MIELRVNPQEGAVSLTAIKFLAFDYPGEHELTLLIEVDHDAVENAFRRVLAPETVKRGAEVRRLRLGVGWRYSGSEECMAALGEFGEARIVGER